MTTDGAPKSLRERAAAANPAAAQNAQVARDKAYIIENYWPKTRAFKHARGYVAEITGPHERSATFDNEFTEWEVMTVHLDPNQTELYEDNEANPGQFNFDVRLPKDGEAANPNSEIVLTVESAQQIEGGRGVKDYFDLEHKVVEFVADVKVLPKRKNDQYATRVWFYNITFVGGTGGLQTEGGETREVDAFDVNALAQTLIGKKKGSQALKNFEILKSIGSMKTGDFKWNAEAALSSLVTSGGFVEEASKRGLVAFDENDVLVAVEA